MDHLYGSSEYEMMDSLLFSPKDWDDEEEDEEYDDWDDEEEDEDKDDDWNDEDDD